MSPGRGPGVAPRRGSGRRRRRCAGGGAAARGAPHRRPRDARRCPAPKRGVKSRPQRSTVPVPSASGTNDSACCPAASRADRRESPSSAGRSPSRAATGTPGPAARIPAQMASLSPVPGSGTTRPPRPPGGGQALVAADEDQATGGDRLQGGREGVGGDRGTEVGAVRADRSGQAGLAVARVLDGDHDVPAGGPAGRGVRSGTWGRRSTCWRYRPTRRAAARHRAARWTR